MRDYGLLGSALARPRSSVFGQDACPDVWQKAAALMESLARNYALVDGNKRLAWCAAWVFLHMNGRPLDPGFDVDEASDSCSTSAGEGWTCPRSRPGCRASRADCDLSPICGGAGRVPAPTAPGHR
ncbi:hypothetical protein SUDANB146_04036 [Streptomyces sp. enrichment culture]